ncbi:MAG: MFS transporter [Alphaproteobacteria bacterium]|nr:MFS transporter [Alphaproteobacteria bacterium]
MTESPAAAVPGARRRPTRRAEYFTYASGLFTDSQSELISFIIPIWAIALGMGPLEIGILVSAKAVLPSVFAIHGGVLMDRFGTRFILLIMGAACTVMPPFFAIASWFPALLLLQMALGMVMSVTWMGAQALAVTVGKDDPAIVGRFSFFARVGVMFAPLGAGALWDLAPPWVAFAVVGVIGFLFWGAVRALPAAELGEGSETGSRPAFHLGDILPRLSDYLGAAGLLVIPTVAFVVVVSSIRLSTGTLQSSFYLVYLKEIGLQATVIGLFVTITQIGAAAGTLLAARLIRFVHPVWAFLGLVMVSVTLIFGTPIFGDVLVMLGVAIAIRGMAQGASQPIMYSTLSKAVGPETQGMAIGLRATGNRVTALLLPVFMGAIAEAWGLDATFFVTGSILVLILAGIGLWMGIRHPEAVRS